LKEKDLQNKKIEKKLKEKDLQKNREKNFVKKLFSYRKNKRKKGK